MVMKDDRTKEQKKTHTWLVIGTDKFLSGWGGAQGGASVAVWACKPEDRKKVLSWVHSRTDMLRVRETSEENWTVDGKKQGFKRYRPKGNVAHCHIYVVKSGHPALES
jgi:hypothetical protein